GHRARSFLLGGLVSSERNHTVAVFVNGLRFLHTHADTTSLMTPMISIPVGLKAIRSGFEQTVRLSGEL
ncbi:MAG TPA: hypothetical protein VK359_00945, partial [Rubrobacteraceae bacterium]|nr:hypothetical protein [Rubrobacteraceae bacterium]